MTVTSSGTAVRPILPTRQIQTEDGEIVEAPYDPTCGACRSPWNPEIDRYLAQGLSYEAVRRGLAGRKPGVPNIEILHRHVDHLPEYQRELRLQLEDPGRSLIGAVEGVDAIVQHGFKMLADGRMELSGSEWLRALKLKADIEKSQAAFASAQEYSQAFLAFFDLARKFIPGPAWPGFQAACFADPAIRAVSPSVQPRQEIVA